MRGLTKRHPALPEPLRGTYAGLASAEITAYLGSLGVSTVELLPVHTFVDDSYLLDKGLKNYWGYNTIGFFAPARRYAANADFAFAEFKEMVAHLHDAGLELILDVVYNHTAEGNELGPTLSFKGIDNASYYRLAPDPRHYINDTGTGNTVNLSNSRVLQMVMDSLRYWANDMRVDGFRFDLATILAREPHGFDEDGRFLDACRQDPTLSQVKLIAEPWDIGPGGYQVGRFSPGWAEWNDRYRDTVRAYWRGDDGKLPDLAARLTASADLFANRGRKPWASINFIAAHDGFTLNDLVSYNDKHNEANGEDNRDGHSHNLSANYGVEGPTDDPQIRATRFTPNAQHAGDAAAVARHAHAAGRRRVRAQPGWQQQQLLPGQRDLVDRLGRSRAGRPRPGRVRAQAADDPPGAAHAAARPLPHRRLRRGDRRQGRGLADAGPLTPNLEEAPCCRDSGSPTTQMRSGEAGKVEMSDRQGSYSKELKCPDKSLPFGQNPMTVLTMPLQRGRRLERK